MTLLNDYVFSLTLHHLVTQLHGRQRNTNTTNIGVGEVL